MSILARLCFLVWTTIANYVSVGDTAPPINLIFLGNPGVGKSSLLNQLHHKAAFAAGLNIGRGMTTETAIAPSFTYEGREVRLIDTPGLADSAMREHASEQITQGLRQGDDYKMVFVVKEEAGRVVDQDRTTISLILESIEGVDLQNNYAIIVNKVDDEVMPRLEAEFQTFTALLMDGFPYSTGQVLLLPEDSRLKNKDNVVLPQDDHLTEKLVKFLSLVPPVHIPKEAAKKIAYEKYEERHTKMRDGTEQLVVAMQEMMKSMSLQAEKAEDKHAALIGQLMEAQRENANQKNEALLQLMESQRANAEYMERMRSEQAAREAERYQKMEERALLSQRENQAMMERMQKRQEASDRRLEAAMRKKR